MTSKGILQKIVSVLCLLVLLEVNTNGNLRRRRSIAQLASMIACVTRTDWVYYITYGCYCGPGGYGKPVDEIDRCCQEHDSCYDQVMSSIKCLFPLEVYFLSYQVTGCNYCKTSNTACAMAICRCDSTLTKCLKDKKLQKRYKLFDKTKCKL